MTAAVNIASNYGAYYFRLFHEVSVENVHQVGTKVDEWWCLVCFVFCHVVAAKYRHIVLVYKPHAASVFLSADVVGIHRGHERFKITHQIERHHMLLMHRFKSF